MKKFKRIVCILALIMMIFALTGCLSIEMNVKKNGGLEMCYIIDTEATGNLLPVEDIKEAITASVDDINDTAGKTVASLKSVKENKGKQTITAIIDIKDINDMGDDFFFGTVKEYQKEYNSRGLDKLFDKKDNRIDQEKVPKNLHMVYFPLMGATEYNLVNVTVSVPGTIEYITSSGEITGKSTATFSEQNLIVVFKRGGSFTFLLLLVLIIIVIAFFIWKAKNSSSSPKYEPISAKGVEAPNVEEVHAGTSDSEKPLVSEESSESQSELEEPSVPEESPEPQPDSEKPSVLEESSESQPESDEPAE